MKYIKPFLTYEQQADRLIALGMQGDRTKIINCLRTVSYYRLSGYWYPFRKQDPADPDQKLSEFNSDASIDVIWERYVFDRRLRLLVMDAIERIEVDARSRLTYFHAERYGPFGYVNDRSTLPKLTAEDRSRLLDGLRRQFRDSREDFVVHFRDKYGHDHPDLPIWVACELMSFGDLFTLYRGCDPVIQKAFADQYNIPDAVCLSWLRALNTLRNICAHHSRLWNRVHGPIPSIPTRDPLWNHPTPIPNNRVFCILTICRYLLSIIAPGSDWTDRLKGLLAEYPNVPRKGMGLIPDWELHPVWKLE